jgi:hypothetical protein
MISFDRAWVVVKEEVDVYGNSPVNETFQISENMVSHSTMSEMFGDGTPIDEQYTLLTVHIHYPRRRQEEGHHSYGEWRSGDHQKIESHEVGADDDYFFYYPDGTPTKPSEWRWEPRISPDTDEPYQEAIGSYEFYSGDERWHEDGSLSFRQDPNGVWELVDVEGSCPSFIMDKLNERGYDVSKMQHRKANLRPGYGGIGDWWKE